MTKDKRPVGFAMAPATNPDALQKIRSLSGEQKQAVIAETHTVKSRESIRRYADSMVNKQ